MASDDKLKVFFIPFYATGHLIPMLDLAFLFSARPNISATFVTTPSNAALLRQSLDLYPAVNLLLYQFPAAESDLLPGQENISSIPFSAISNLCSATDHSERPIKHLLSLHRPDAIVADVSFCWMPSAARELGIPNIVFHAIGVFPQLALDSFHKERSYELSTQEPSSSRLVKHIPGAEIHVQWSEVPTFLRTTTYLTERWGRMKAAQAESYGVVVNTLYEMEAEYCEEYRRAACGRAWFVGPTRVAVRTKMKHVDSRRHSALGWLDGRPEGSVVFVCFGSWCNFSDEQLRELATGIEQSQREFLWVVRGCKDGEVTDDDRWMPVGWEERVKERGMVAKGWAPQAEILRHNAVGVFVTHCGWNSVLEAAAAGVPVMTWPLVFEQFMNEKLVVEVVGSGVKVWEGFRSAWPAEVVVVPGEAIGKAISTFMTGEEWTRARARATEMREKARAAVEEGGTSETDLVCLINELVEVKKKKKKKNMKKGERVNGLISSRHMSHTHVACIGRD